MTNVTTVIATAIASIIPIGMFRLMLDRGGVISITFNIASFTITVASDYARSFGTR